MDMQLVLEESDQQVTPENDTSVDAFSTPGDYQSWSPFEFSQYTLIAVMGVTGSGKTTFVNRLTESSLKVGNDLESCTSEIQVSEEIILEGRRVILIDTPGFDDTNKSDTDVLKLIAAFLAETYSAGVKLAGVIYVHRISDDRFGGLATKNFRMFRELCGEKTLKNVILMTNMWGRVTPQEGATREQQLGNKYFREAIEKGAQMRRHDNTLESAQAILRIILRNQPVVLKIQHELVDEHKNIEQTGAGEELNREISRLVMKYQREMRELEESIRKAIEDKDEESRQELEEEKRRAREEIEKLQQASAEMHLTMADLQKQLASIWRCVVM